MQKKGFSRIQIFGTASSRGGFERHPGPAAPPIFPIGGPPVYIGGYIYIERPAPLSGRCRAAHGYIVCAASHYNIILYSKKLYYYSL